MLKRLHDTLAYLESEMGKGNVLFQEGSLGKHAVAEFALVLFNFEVHDDDVTVQRRLGRKGLSTLVAAVFHASAFSQMLVQLLLRKCVVLAVRALINLVALQNQNNGLLTILQNFQTLAIDQWVVGTLYLVLVCVFLHGCERGHGKHFPHLFLLVLVQLLAHFPLVQALNNVLLAPDVGSLQTLGHHLDLGGRKALLLQKGHYDFLLRCTT